MPQPISHAFVLAAGLGTRMRPLTEHRPKPLIAVAGKTLLDHNLDALSAAGIAEAVVNAHYLGDQVMDHVAARADPRTVISDERDLLRDSGGGVRHGLSLLEGEAFFILNADSFWIDAAGSNLESMMKHWHPDKMDVLMLLARHDQAIGFSGKGDFFMEPHKRLTRRGAADAAPYIYAGVLIAKRNLFESQRAEVFSLNTLFDAAIEAQRLCGLVMEGLWLHVGTPDAIGAAQEAIAELS